MRLALYPICPGSTPPNSNTCKSLLDPANVLRGEAQGKYDVSVGAQPVGL